MSDHRIAAWAAVLRAHAAVLPQLERAVQRAGLSLTWYDVLLVLNAAPDRTLTMTELGRRAVVSRERVSRVVTDLEREGLVERRENPTDKRSSFAAITDEGRQRLRRAAPTYLAAIEAHFIAHMSSHEAVAVTRALSKVVMAEESREG